MSRDWTSTLFPASYNGALFWVEHDAAETGRRLRIDDIPGGDNPSVEDLGRRTREVEVAGYVVGDSADAAMVALEAACEILGIGVLVMPAQGPIAARCRKIKRRRDRDKMGKFAFEAEFVRDDGITGAAPAAWLAQGVFSAVAGLTATATAFLNNGVEQ